MSVTNSWRAKSPLERFWTSIYSIAGRFSKDSRLSGNRVTAFQTVFVIEKSRQSNDWSKILRTGRYSVGAALPGLKWIKQR